MALSTLAFPRHRGLILILLALAAVHCTFCIFSSNVSIVSLPRYVQGLERNPYQSRVAMMPVLRAAEQSPAFVHVAARLEAMRQNGSFGHRDEPLSPEKLACMIVGLASVLSMTALAAWFGWRHQRMIWWLSPVLVLVILYVTYAARMEANLWYPCDLPHFAIFGAACLAILEGWWLPFLALFLIDLPFRETGFFLLPAVCLVSRVRGQMKQGIAVTTIAGIGLIAFHLWAKKLYGANPTEMGIHATQMLHTLINPLHWPQTLSALSFLIPLILGRARLRHTEWVFLWSALPGLATTLAFGVWYESRIFDEWALVVAVLLTREVASLIRQHTRETHAAAPSPAS